MTTTTFVEPTEKQIQFLLKLASQRTQFRDTVSEDKIRQGIAEKHEQCSRRVISTLIDGLMKIKPDVVEDKPATPKLPDVPAGYYALVNNDDHKTYFFKVDRPTEGRWAGYTFVKRVSGDNELRVDRTEAPNILNAIARNPLEAATRYGHETKSCGICHRRLTDETSRTLGIGPVCLKKHFGDGAEDIAWKLAYARREAEQERAAYQAEMEYENNYRQCEHGMDADLCAGPQHYDYDEDERRAYGL